MFAVYGVTGRVFSGTSDQLKQVGALQAATRTRAIQPSGREGSAPGGHAGEAADGAQRHAISAYEQTQRGSVERQPVTRVVQLMSQEVISVAREASVAQAWQLLETHRLGQLPVLDPQGVLVGLLLRTDLLPSLAHGSQEWGRLLQQAVGDTMWTPVPGVAADTDIRRVAQVLLDTGLPGLPVTDDNGGVTGFISRSDILRAIVTDPPLDLWG